MTKKQQLFAVIAGGGTAGHVNPALAVADALVARGHSKASLLFVGSKRGLEARLVPEDGYAFVGLSGRGIVRKVNVDAVRAVLGLLVALVRAFAILARRRPHVVLSVGGYASAPCAVAAVVLRIPLILAESNVQPGAANRLVARFAKASAVAIAGTPLPRAEVTGNPVRGGFVAPLERAAARAELGVDPDRVMIAAFGGSLGARTINTALVALAEQWSDRDLTVYHVLGRRDWDDAAVQKYAGQGALDYRGVDYERRMPAVLAAADIVVCRSGTTTVAELAAAGRPAVFVPFPGATGDHQTANARALAAAGAAVVIADRDCDADTLRNALAPLIGDAAHRELMGNAARGLARPDAADAVAALVERHAGSRTLASETD